MRGVIWAICGVSALGGGVGAPALAQPTNPVYADDSPAAQDTLVRVEQLVESGNEPEAARALQELLTREPDRVVPSDIDPDLFWSVRDSVHRKLLAHDRLLERYRTMQEPWAADALADGRHREVERSALLTRSGFEATLRVTQERLEEGHFDAAARALLQLDRHPDLDGRPGRDALEMAALLLRYTDRADLRSAARRWAGWLGADEPDPEPVEPPPALSVQPADVFSGGGRIDVSQVPAEPIWSRRLDAEDLAEGGGRVQGGAPFRPALWTLPTIVGDTLLINDTVWIRAWDRLTLEPLWRTRPALPEGFEADLFREAWAQRTDNLVGRRPLEDTNSVTVADGIVVAATGFARDGQRDGDERVHALDLETGRVLWSAWIPSLDPRLDETTVRGPIVIDSGVAVVGMRKRVRTRRLTSYWLVGLDLGTGELRWIRPVASSGSLPMDRDYRVAAANASDAGVVYATDHIGAFAAVEASTGRPLWVRRVGTAEIGYSVRSFAWEWVSPILDGRGDTASLIVLTPDRDELLRLDRRTGRITERRSALGLGDEHKSPQYITRTGDFLAAVDRSTVSLLPLARLPDSPVRRYENIGGDGGIVGRAVDAEGTLYIPVADGVRVIDPSLPGAQPGRPEPPHEGGAVGGVVGGHAKLQHPGTVLPLPEQLLVVDDDAVHSYLAWPVAERLLMDRIGADPDNAAPAVSFADLAHRTNRPARIPDAADRALEAIARRPFTDANQAARDRLFGTLLEAVHAGQHSWDSPDRPAMPLSVMEQLVARLGRAAGSHAQQVSHLFALGPLRRAQGSPALAVEAYQAVLADPALREAPWEGEALSTRAEFEAARRIRDIVMEHGPSIYRAFEAEAAAALAALGEAAPAQEYEALARRYPSSRLASRAWARAATSHTRQGRTHDAAGALAAGLMAAEVAYAAGVEQSTEALAELAGRLVSALSASDRVSAAAQILSRLRRDYPGLELTRNWEPLDIDAIESDLHRRLSSVSRLPRIGTRIVGEVQVIADWSLLKPVSRRGADLAADHIVLVSHSRGEVALFGPEAGAGHWQGASAQGEAGRLRKLWSRSFDERPPVLLRVDPESVYLLWDPDTGEPQVERIDAIDGRTRWRTGGFSRLFGPEAAVNRRARDPRGRPVIFTSPMHGEVRMDDLMIAIDQHVVALVERSGRVALFDPHTGHTLASFVSDVATVFDMDVADGHVVLSGSETGPDAAAGAGRPVRVAPLIMAYDARTGRAVGRIDRFQESVRWLRMGPPPGDQPHAGRAPTLVLGRASGITAVSLPDGDELWSRTAAPARDSVDAWVFGDRLFTIDRSRQLREWPLAGQGPPGGREIQTRDRLAVPSRVEATRLDDRVAFATRRGLVIVGPDGRTVGVDGLSVSADALVFSLPAESCFVVVDHLGTRDDRGRWVYRMHLLSTDTAELLGTHRLRLWDRPEPPRQIAVLDGRVVLTAGEATLVYQLPSENR